MGHVDLRRFWEMYTFDIVLHNTGYVSAIFPFVRKSTENNSEQLRSVVTCFSKVKGARLVITSKLAHVPIC